MALRDSTLLYHGATSFYITLLWLYLILHYSTMVLLDST